jgi:hypothetical protein
MQERMALILSWYFTENVYMAATTEKLQHLGNALMVFLQVCKQCYAEKVAKNAELCHSRAEDSLFGERKQKALLLVVAVADIAREEVMAAPKHLAAIQAAEDAAKTFAVKSLTEADTKWPVDYLLETIFQAFEGDAIFETSTDNAACLLRLAHQLVRMQGADNTADKLLLHFAEVAYNVSSCHCFLFSPGNTPALPSLSAALGETAASNISNKKQIRLECLHVPKLQPALAVQGCST